MPHLNFAYEIAAAICSGHNQHATLLIWAPTGKGKSWAGGSIGETVAQYVSEIKGGSPDDYFTAENVAVITHEEVLRVLSTKIDKKYSVIGFDDIGLAWSARDFMDRFNQAMNDIAQTIRTRNLFAYFTLPDPFLIDKVPRELIRYVCKVESSHFDQYYTECKIQEPMKKVQWGKKIYPYLLDLDGNRINRHIVFRPSKKWTDDYEPRRALIERQNTITTVEEMQQIVTEASTPQEPRTSKRVLFSQPMKADYNNGEGLSMAKIAEKYGVSTQTVYEAIHYQPPQKPAENNTLSKVK